MQGAMQIEFHRNALTAAEQRVVAEGFREYDQKLQVPEYVKEQVKWLGVDDLNEVSGS